MFPHLRAPLAPPPAVNDENDNPLFNALLTKSFSNFASKRGMNFARQKHVSGSMSKLSGGRRQGYRPPVEKARIRP